MYLNCGQCERCYALTAARSNEAKADSQVQVQVSFSLIQWCESLIFVWPDKRRHTPRQQQQQQPQTVHTTSVRHQNQNQHRTSTSKSDRKVEGSFA